MKESARVFFEIITSGVSKVNATIREEENTTQAYGDWTSSNATDDDYNVTNATYFDLNDTIADDDYWRDLNDTVADDDYWREISSLSDAQEKTLSLLALSSGTLSFLGSCIIIYLVTNSPRNRRISYGRIMLVLSLCDLVVSFSFAASGFLLPSDTSQRVWAIGNDATCTFLGFMSQMAYAAPWYNGVLSFYYLMTIRYGVSRRVFAKKYEPYIHFFSLSFFLVSASLGAIVGLYSESEIGQGCWIGEYPAGCEARGDCYGQYFGWIFAALPMTLLFLALPLFNLSIYRFVRGTLKRNQRYDPKGSSAQTQRRRSQAQQTQAIATQAFLYVGTFYLSYTPSFFVRAVEGLSFDAYQEDAIFPLLALAALLSPLQGFFNVLIFVRPNYIHLRKTFPESSRLWGLYKVLHQPDIQAFANSRLSSMSPSTHTNRRPVSTNTKQHWSHVAASSPAHSRVYSNQSEISIVGRPRSVQFANDLEEEEDIPESASNLPPTTLTSQAQLFQEVAKAKIEEPECLASNAQPVKWNDLDWEEGEGNEEPVNWNVSDSDVDLDTSSDESKCNNGGEEEGPKGEVSLNSSGQQSFLLSRNSSKDRDTCASELQSTQQAGQSIEPVIAEHDLNFACNEDFEGPIGEAANASGT